MPRKLASVQIIKDIQPIEGADSIEVVLVLGWKVVAKKGEFKVGEKVVYIEIDSLLPPTNPYWSFLEKNGLKKTISNGEEITGILLRTIRLRGQVSQGLIVPTRILPKGQYLEGQDVTQTLSIVKSLFNYSLP
jgi:RNA ligase (TIGR02306 family)